MKECPYCAEEIKDNAIKRIHCQSDRAGGGTVKKLKHYLDNHSALFNYFISVIALCIAVIAVILPQGNLADQKKYELRSNLISKCLYLQV